MTHVINQDALSYQGGCADVVVINPPFSNRSSGGRGSRFYWRFITHAQKLVAPGGVLVFIAPDGWETCLNKETRNGKYEVMSKTVPFVGAPSASVVRWSRGPFIVVGGRSDSIGNIPVPPNFDVLVSGVRAGRMQLRPDQWAVNVARGNIVAPQNGASVTCRDPVFEGPDAEAAARWVHKHRHEIIKAYGASANGLGCMTVTKVRGALRK